MNVFLVFDFDLLFVGTYDLGPPKLSAYRSELQPGDMKKKDKAHFTILNLKE